MLFYEPEFCTFVMRITESVPVQELIQSYRPLYTTGLVQQKISNISRLYS